MKTIELSELQKEVLLTHTEILTVTHNGKIIGHFYPVPQNQAEIDRLWERLEKARMYYLDDRNFKASVIMIFK